MKQITYANIAFVLRDVSGTLTHNPGRDRVNSIAVTCANATVRNAAVKALAVFNIVTAINKDQPLILRVPTNVFNPVVIQPRSRSFGDLEHKNL